MSCFKVGFSSRIISPEVGARLFGYPGARASQSLHDDLTVNAIAFSNGDDLGLMISMDLCTFPLERNIALRQKIEEETNVSYDKIILTTIHTHSGPITAGSSKAAKGWGSADDTYIGEVLVPQTIAAAKEALSKLESAVMGVGVTQSNAGINRREIAPDGTVILGQNPDGPYDSRMVVLSFKKESGEPIVSIVHFGCHPTAAGQAPEISRDWPGFMVDRLAQETGAPAVFFNSAIGDIGPRLSNGKTCGDMVLTEEIGNIAGEDAVKAYKNISSYTKPEFSVKSDILSLPARPLPTLEETKKLIKDLGNPEDLMYVNITLYERYCKIVELYENNLPIEDSWNFTQTYIALDDVVFVPYPYEMFCLISMNQQKASPFKHTLCLSNANGSRGYLPTPDQIPYGGYEIESFLAKNVVLLEENAAEQIVEANENLLNKLFK